MCEHSMCEHPMCEHMWPLYVSRMCGEHDVWALYVAVGQKSWTKSLILGGHNRHFYMILQVRYVASRKEIPQNTS